MLKKFHQDMVRLGLRPRRQHDLRRTFISLRLGDGASKDILRWITHAPEGDLIDDYTTLVWRPALPGGCQAPDPAHRARSRPRQLTSRIHMQPRSTE